MDMQSIVHKKCHECDASYPHETLVCPHDGSQLATVLSHPLSGSNLADRYEFLDEIGRGGMGVLYKARKLADGSEVAIKLLISDASTNDLMRNRFLVEARAASSMSHPNIIRIHEYEVSEHGLPYIVMDYLRGVSLQEVLKDAGRLDVERALRIFVDACDALGHAHRRQIVHRDIKPSNIMMQKNEDGHDVPVIVDFGIAKIFAQPGQTSLKLTQTGEIFGSALYMSPEQCMGQKVDARSDVYSFGCVMYECLTGEPPFSGDNFLSVIFQHVNDDPEPFHRSDCTEELESIVFKAMAKRPYDRFQSMTELRDALERALEIEFACYGHSDEEFEAIEAKAIDGDANAQFELALFYRDGVYGEQNLERAFQWCLKAAEQGLPEAQSELGGMYRDGTGVERDTREAFHWFELSSNNGNPLAQACLGELYHLGDGVEQSSELALKWYRESAVAGNTWAQNRLGDLYLHGDVVDKDAQEAARWYMRGAEQGDPESQVAVGWMCEIGDGFEQSFEAALEWYRRASDQGWPDAYSRIAYFYLHGTGVEKNEELAVEWYSRGAEAGHALSQGMLAECYENGMGVAKDEEQALGWMSEAAENGDSQAQMMMGFWYSQGTHGLPQDAREATRLFKLSADRGNAAAMYFLGFQYLNGDGVRQNNTMAATWFRRAADLDNADAQYELALCYRDGRGVEKSRADYSKWLRRAADQGLEEAQRLLKESREQQAGGPRETSMRRRQMSNRPLPSKEQKGDTAHSKPDESGEPDGPDRPDE